MFYDPTIQWLFYVTVAGVFGLTHYFWKKLNLAPWLAEDEASNNIAGEAVSDTNEVKA